MSLDKLSITLRKSLRCIVLCRRQRFSTGLLRDVKKLGESCELHCMSPIHVYLDSNLKIQNLFGLEGIERADMSPLQEGSAHQRIARLDV